MNECLEGIWSRVNDIFAVDFCGNGCNHVGDKNKINKISKSIKKSRVTLELHLDRTSSSLMLINFNIHLELDL